MLARILIARIRSLILRRWEYPPENPNILWSKGWYSVADWSGDNNYAYPHLDKIICDHGHAPNNWNDMDTICNIIIERINEYKNENTISN